MKIKFIKIVSLTILAITLSLLLGCSSNNEASASGTAQVQFKLMDAPGDYEQVNVEIVDIQYNYSDNDNGWRSFSSFDGPVIVDLTTLIAGNTLLLSNEVIEAGNLNQVRLILGDNNTLLLEGETALRVLDTPSAQQSGLKLKLNEQLEPGFTYSFVLDWDVQNSIVATGSGKYNLKPVIRVNAEKNSGSITGVVVDGKSTSDTSDDQPVAEALVSVYTDSNVFVAQTLTNTEGKFMVAGLPAGNYIVKVKKDNFIDFTSTSTFTVSVGNVVQVGSFILLGI